jgi:hypothetical protein
MSYESDQSVAIGAGGVHEAFDWVTIPLAHERMTEPVLLLVLEMVDEPSLAIEAYEPVQVFPPALHEAELAEQEAAALCLAEHVGLDDPLLVPEHVQEVEPPAEGNEVLLEEPLVHWVFEPYPVEPYV